MGSCSCSSSCQYYGNCCRDYYYYCQMSSTSTPTTGGHSCENYLSHSGTFTSPNHPGYYYNSAYCTWQLRVQYGQKVFLSFTFVELENCCSCDYVEVYDGPYVGAPLLGRVCNKNGTSFHSSSNYVTVLFRTDSSVVGRGFKAEFTSSLPPSSGRVDCSANMTIVISTFYLNSLGYDGSNVYLDDPLCRPQFSKYNVTFSFPIDSCGNVKTFEDGRTVYTNSLRAYPTTYGEITRQDHLKLLVGCRMEQDSVSQIMYRVEHRDNSSITGSGRYATLMHFYTSSSFSYKVTQVPYEVLLNQELFVQVEMENKDRSLVVFIDTCLASPSPHDFQTRAYYLVRNGCGADSTYKAYASGFNNYARFSFKAFQFLRATESVYLQCKVLICQASDANSRCRRGCSRRKTRDLQAQHDSQTLVTGPIQLKGFKKKDKE
ncbi:unnamed protein product [Tetraodon nigroviridis]|uniref:(spotted green pufferfish) hypothetical protein n=1 Tax=Tetraodon nigroviridis TaxID=99883 RepID=Q4S2Q2_TETNG|nr:unnamed protein product [Tetraodon nigroviridis]